MYRYTAQKKSEIFQNAVESMRVQHKGHKMKLITAIVTLFSACNLSAREIDRAIPINSYFAQKAAAVKAEKFVKSLIEVFPGTQSHKYSWLETGTIKRAEFLLKTKEQAQVALKKGDFLKISAFLAPAKTETEKTINTFEVSDTRKIILSSLNFERRITDINQDQKTVIFSSTTDTEHQTYVYDIFPSPDKKFLAILIGYDGTIDNTWVLIYDVEQSKMIQKFEHYRWEQAVTWWTADSIIMMHPESSEKGYSLAIQNVVTMEQTLLINHGTISIGDWIGYADFVTDDITLKNLKTSQLLTYSHLKVSTFVTEDDHYFYLLNNYSKENTGVVFKLAKVSEAQLEHFLPSVDKTFLESVSYEEGYIFAKYLIDATNILKIFNMKAELIDQIVIPNQIDLASYSWSKAGEVVSLDLSSSVVTSKKFEWTLHTKVNESELLKDMFKADDLEIETRIEYITSFDGEKIPLRLTYKKGLLLDGNRPVYMETYGGFLLSGYLSPPIAKMHLEFIKRGGVVVGTGVRGGAEKGYAWFSAAAGPLKYVTSYDLVACAKALVTLGISKPEKIISTGASNGGYVVASAALISPESFGLVIPVNGVQDQLNFTDLDRWGMGWQDDYTNPYDPKNFTNIVKRAPLEYSPKTTKWPEFLIINGEQDTRVNKVHSYKLKAVLDEKSNQSVVLFSVDHAGHGPFSRRLGEVGIQASSTMWAKIFEFSGLRFE